MAAPLAAAAKVAAKKIITDIATDPSVIIKYICILLGSIFGILSIFILPFYVMTNIPSLLVGSSEQEFVNAKIIKMYQDAVVEKNNELKEWIDNKKISMRCDSYTVKFDFDLSYAQLIAVDTIRYSQDFSKVTPNKIDKLIELFIEKNTKTETYTEYLTYTETVLGPDGKPVLGIDGKPLTTKKTKKINRTKGIITISTKKLNDVLKAFSFDDTQKLLANNYLITMQSVDVEGNFNIYDDINLGDLKEYLPGDSKIPLFFQFDARWGNASYGSSTIKSGGCGPTCLSMVVVGLTGRNVTPLDVANWSVANGHRAEGQGSYWSLMTAGGKYYGLQVEAISRKNPSRIADELSKGNPIIAAMGPGHFTKAGHFIVLRGIDADGNVYVNDPASAERSKKVWSLGIICGESSTNGGSNGSPFWVFKK
ncbi:MAG TPA: hypothetical protein GXX73_14230 [Clostridium sp.]|nr:hypothetical protein [Clostridium sp.]